MYPDATLPCFSRTFTLIYLLIAYIYQLMQYMQSSSPLTTPHPMAPWTIYQEHLRGLDQGLPLWDPSPKNALEIIEGSVIYPGVSGTFSVLFNARKSADDARWQPHGVPRGFRTLDDEFGPLVVDGPRELIGLRGWNCRSVECTRNVSGDLDVGM